MQPSRSTAGSVLSEIDIQAFVDGLLSPERAAQMQRYLHDRPDEARRVAFYGKLNRQMQASFQHSDDEGRAPLSCLRFYGAVLAGSLRRRARAIAVILLVALPVAGAFVWAAHVPDDALDAAAIMALERATAMKALPDRGADGRTLAAAPDLSGVGMHAMGPISQRVGPFARASGFVYRNAAGELAVLLSAPDLTATAQPHWQARRVGTSRVLNWTTARTRFVLAGRADTRGLMRAADLMAPH
jgi:hypothetical protein